MPTKRTWIKFGRGCLLALGAAGIVFVGDNLADLNMPAELTPFAVALLGFVYRWVRGLQGNEPEGVI